MTRKWRIRIPAPLWFATLGFLAAAFVSVHEITLRQKETFESFRTGAWAVVQLDSEAGRLENAIMGHYADPLNVTTDDIDLAVDLLYSRFPVVLEGQRNSGMRRVNGMVDLILQAQAAMQPVEVQIARIKAGEPNTLPAVTEALHQLRDPVRSAVRLGIALDQETFEPRLRDGQIGFVLDIGFVVLAGGFMVTIAIRQSRRSQRLGDLAQIAAEAADMARTRLVDALNAISEAFVYFGPDGRLVMANDRFRQLHKDLGPMMQIGLDYPTFTQEIVERGLVKLDGPAEDWILERIAASAEPQASFEMEMPGGRIVLVNERRTREGGLVSVRTDVTEITRARELLAKRLHAMEASLNGIALIDPEGHVIYANLAFATIHEYERPDDLIGQPWRHFWDPAEAMRIEREILPMVGREGTWFGETRGQRAKGGVFPQETSLTRTSDGGLALAVGDISERKRAELESAVLREQFFNAQKLEAIGRLAGGIAHDFNNILAAVNGYANMLIEDLPANSETQGFARSILSAGERAKGLIREILAFSRTEKTERTTVRLNGLVDETLSMLRATLPTTIRLDIQLAEASPLVNANATQISQVLMNLCVNARDAIDERGKSDGAIRITSSVVAIDGGCAEGLASGSGSNVDASILRIDGDTDADATRIWMGRLSPGPHVLLSVRDNGIGMPADVMERIFDPFFSTKEVGKGTGLGLAAVHGIVTQHDGAITIESRIDEGTVFHIFLPVAVDRSEIPPAPLPKARPAARSATILVVDDEEMVATMIARSLERLGYEVVCTTTPEEALEAFRENPDAFDIVITDQTMPGMSGVDLGRTMLAMRPSLPVILCTGYSDSATEASARAGGIAAFISKPARPSELALEVERLLAVA